MKALWQTWKQYRVAWCISLGLSVPLAPAHADFYALLIGASNYPVPYRPLPSAAADVGAINKVLKDQGPLYKTIVLTDSTERFIADQRLPLTHDNLLGRLKWLQANIHNSDTVFVMYVGHGVIEGSAEPNGQKGSRLLLPSVKNGKIEVFDAKEFRFELNRISAHALVVTYEICRNGLRLQTSGAGEEQMDEQLARDLAPVSTHEQSGVFAGPRIAVTLFSCRPTELSYALNLGEPPAEHGVFSYFLMRGLRGDANPGGGIQISNLVPYLEKSVYTEVRTRLFKEQTPWSVIEGPGALELQLTPPVSKAPPSPQPPPTAASIYRAEMLLGFAALQALKYSEALEHFKTAIGNQPVSALTDNQIALTNNQIALAHDEIALTLYRQHPPHIPSWYPSHIIKDIHKNDILVYDIRFASVFKKWMDFYRSSLDNGVRAGKAGEAGPHSATVSQDISDNTQVPSDESMRSEHAWVQEAAWHYATASRLDPNLADPVAGLSDLYYDYGWRAAKGFALAGFIRGNLESELKRKALVATQAAFKQSHDLNDEAIRLDFNNGLRHVYNAENFLWLHSINQNLTPYGEGTDSSLEELVRQAREEERTAGFLGYMNADYDPSGVGSNWADTAFKEIERQSQPVKR